VAKQGVRVAGRMSREEVGALLRWDAPEVSAYGLAPRDWLYAGSRAMCNPSHVADAFSTA
jgi:hypothetical protein